MATRALEISPPAADGRVRRGERSEQAIVEAMLELVGKGILEPTAEQVARRARVGIRTVFRRFSDMESLFQQMGTHMQAQVLPFLLGGEPKGGVEARARALVRQRVLFFERIAPYKRAANLQRLRSPFLSADHALLVRGLRDDLARWLPEIRRAPAAILEALDLATSFEAWDRLRTEQRLGRERAQAAVQTTVLALVAPLVDGRES